MGSKEQDLELIKKASENLKNSYSPYSNFKVAAAIRTKNGNVYLGTNVENASYGLCCCAERVALFNAFSAGEREVECIAIISSSDADFCMPCGACRAVIAELAPNAKVLCCKNVTEYQAFSPADLIPHNFKL